MKKQIIFFIVIILVVLFLIYIFLKGRNKQNNHISIEEIQRKIQRRIDRLFVLFKKRQFLKRKCDKRIQFFRFVSITILLGSILFAVFYLNLFNLFVLFDYLNFLSFLIAIYYYLIKNKVFNINDIFVIFDNSLKRMVYRKHINNEIYLNVIETEIRYLSEIKQRLHEGN